MKTKFKKFTLSSLIAFLWFWIADAFKYSWNKSQLSSPDLMTRKLSLFKVWKWLCWCVIYCVISVIYWSVEALEFTAGHTMPCSPWTDQWGHYLKHTSAMIGHNKLLLKLTHGYSLAKDASFVPLVSYTAVKGRFSLEPRLFAIKPRLRWSVTMSTRNP